MNRISFTVCRNYSRCKGLLSCNNTNSQFLLPAVLNTQKFQFCSVSATTEQVDSDSESKSSSKSSQISNNGVDSFTNNYREKIMEKRLSKRFNSVSEISEYSESKDKKKMFDSGSISGPSYGIFMRGLPYNATALDIVKFFEPVRPKHVQINCDPAGRSIGTAKVLFFSQDDVAASMKKNRDYMEKRYVELYEDNSVSSNQAEGLLIGDKQDVPTSNVPQDTTWIKMRGLPYEIQESQINKFFDPIVPKRILFLTHRSGYRNGKARVQFANAEDARNAFKKNKEYIDNRYVEMFQETS